jgi:hypothetical protein
MSTICGQYINLKNIAQSTDASSVTEIKKLTNSLYKSNNHSPQFSTKTSSARLNEIKFKNVLCLDNYISSINISHTISETTTRYHGIEASASISTLKKCSEINEISFLEAKNVNTLNKSSNSCDQVVISKPSHFVYIKKDLYSKRNDNVAAVCSALNRTRAYPVAKCETI